MDPNLFENACSGETDTVDFALRDGGLVRDIIDDRVYFYKPIRTYFYRPIHNGGFCPLVLKMSFSTYAPTDRFKIPEEFPTLLGELTTEILRAQPEDAIGIYNFAYQFFLKKQQEQASGQAKNDDDAQ